MTIQEAIAKMKELAQGRKCALEVHYGVTVDADGVEEPMAHFTAYLQTNDSYITKMRTTTLDAMQTQFEKVAMGKTGEDADAAVELLNGVIGK